MKQPIKMPRLSEKSLALASRGWYTFVVDSQASKNVIAKEIGSLYNVQIKDVRTVRIHGKERRAGRLMKRVRKSDWKKAIVRLAAGQKIDAFEVTTEEKK